VQVSRNNKTTTNPALRIRTSLSFNRFRLANVVFNDNILPLIWEELGEMLKGMN
jgi:hypothetical protein